MMSQAWKFFDVIPVMNDVMWNAMVLGYVELGDLDAVVKLFGDAPVKSVIAWTSMVSHEWVYEGRES